MIIPLEVNWVVDKCCRCGCKWWLDEGGADLHDIDGEPYCDCCAEKYLFWCENCDEYFDKEKYTAYELGEYNYCEKCYKEKTGK